MTRNRIDQTKTPAWREAEKWYNQLHSHAVFSIMGGVLMPGPEAEKSDQTLQEILQLCPGYFPALFQRGEYMLRTGSTSAGEKLIGNAFESLVNTIEDEEEFRQILSARTGNLEKLLRYDLAAEYTEKAVRLFPDTAAYYDELAFYILQLPKRNKSEALKYENEALDIEPDNDYFINNLGWIHLMMGNYREAEENFQKALEFNLDNPGASDNLEIAEYMHGHNLGYFDYLLRPADTDRLQALLEYGDIEEVTAICRMYNSDRLEAFKLHHLEKDSLPAHEILDTLQPLEIFINRLRETVDVIEDGFFLCENIDMLDKKAGHLFYGFIAGFEQADGQLLEDINQSLSAFYDFLRDVKRLTPDRHKQYGTRIAPLITQFSHKIDTYYEILHDVTLEEKERDKKIEALFGI